MAEIHGDNIILEMKAMGEMHWDHIILEGYCVRRSANALQRDKYLYELQADRTFKKIPNEHYVPGTRMPRIPKYCPGEVCVTCWRKKCPHLFLSPALERDREIMVKAWVESDIESKENEGALPEA